jgi:hypothetical protein
MVYLFLSSFYPFLFNCYIVTLCLPTVYSDEVRLHSIYENSICTQGPQLLKQNVRLKSCKKDAEKKTEDHRAVSSEFIKNNNHKKRITRERADTALKIL